MPVVTSDTLNRLVLQGDQNVSVDKNYLVDRFEPSIVANTAVYALPASCLSIRRVTYQGFKLDPLPQRNHREVFQSASQVGRPFWYIFDNVGANNIKLFPTPPTSIAAGVDPWLADIPTKVIVEYWKVADGSSFTMPSYFKRQTLKQYVARQIYALEGPGQKKKISAYYDHKWQMFKAGFIEFLEYVHGRPRKLIVSEIVSSNYFPAAPVLPIAQFGIGVEEGY